MTEHFDPYHKWFGIKPHEQPPNAYRLLGIDLFEPDPDVIEAAAEQRLTFLQTVATGPHAEWSQRLMNEVEQARMCLLNPQRRAIYDQQLQAYLAALAQQSQWTAGGSPLAQPAGPASKPVPPAGPLANAARLPSGTPSAAPRADWQHQVGEAVVAGSCVAASAPGAFPPQAPLPATLQAQTAPTVVTSVAPTQGEASAGGSRAAKARRRARRRPLIPLWATLLLMLGATAVGLWGIYFALSNNRPQTDQRPAAAHAATGGGKHTPRSREGASGRASSGSEPKWSATVAGEDRPLQQTGTPSGPGEDVSPPPPIGSGAQMPAPMEPAEPKPPSGEPNDGNTAPKGEAAHWMRRVATLSGHAGRVRGLAVSADGSVAVSIGDDRTIRIWELDRPRLAGVISANAPTTALALSPDNRWAAVGLGEHIVLIDVQKKEQVQSMEGHRAPVTVVRFAPDSRRFLSGSEDGTARLWKLEQSIEVNGFPGHRRPIVALAVFPDGQQAVTADEEKSVLFWKLDENAPKRRLEVDENLRDLQFSGDGRTLLGLTDQAVLRWDASTWKPLPPISPHDRVGPRLVAFTPWNPAATELMVVDELGGVHLVDAGEPARSVHAVNSVGKVGRAAFCVARQWLLTAPPPSAGAEDTTSADGPAAVTASGGADATGRITVWHWEFGVPEVQQEASPDPWKILTQPAGPLIAPLAFIDLATSTVAGEWSIENDGIRVAAGEHARVMLPGDVPRYYLQQLSVSAEAPPATGSPNTSESTLDGVQSAIALIVPVHGRSATILLDEQTAAGFRCRIPVADGENAEAWQTPPYDRPLFDSRTPRTVQLLVQQRRVLVRVDDQTIFDVPADADFVVPSPWQVRDPEAVAIGAHRRAAFFTNIKRFAVKPVSVEP